MTPKIRPAYQPTLKRGKETSTTYAHITTISHRSSTERHRTQSKMSARTLNSIIDPAAQYQRGETWVASSIRRGSSRAFAVITNVATHTVTAVKAMLERMAAPAEPCNSLAESTSFNKA